MSRNMLRYKAIAHAAMFVDTPENLSTQVCSECRSVGGPKGLKDLIFAFRRTPPNYKLPIKQAFLVYPVRGCSARVVKS